MSQGRRPRLGTKPGPCADQKFRVQHRKTLHSSRESGLSHQQLRLYNDRCTKRQEGTWCNMSLSSPDSTQPRIDRIDKHLPGTNRSNPHRRGSPKFVQSDREYRTKISAVACRKPLEITQTLFPPALPWPMSVASRCCPSAVSTFPTTKTKRNF